MTLPASGAISLTQVLAELRISNPGRSAVIGLGDADVRALAGVASGPISLSNLYGKSSFTVTGNSAGASKSTAAAPQTVSCNPSVTILGGVAPFSYVWSVTASSGSPTVTNLTSASPTVSKNVLQGSDGTAQATLSVTVTDAAANSRTVNGITGDLNWSSGA